MSRLALAGVSFAHPAAPGPRGGARALRSLLDNAGASIPRGAFVLPAGPSGPGDRLPLR